MKSNRILPIVLVVTAAIAGCSGEKDGSPATTSSLFFPDAPPIAGLMTNREYTPCYSKDGLILRGAPLGNDEKGLRKEGRVAVFPTPRIPQGGIGNITPRDLYSNLANRNPQVRSDTLYAMDNILSDPARRNEYPQVQGMLDDYIRNLAREKPNTDEYDTATTLYNHHFPNNREPLDRPNWKGIPGTSFGGHGLEQEPPTLKTAPHSGVSQRPLADAKTDNIPTAPISDGAKVTDAPVKTTEPIAQNDAKPDVQTTTDDEPAIANNETDTDKNIKNDEDADTIDESDEYGWLNDPQGGDGNSSGDGDANGDNDNETVPPADKIPDFDFSDPADAVTAEQTEIEKQMEQNKELGKQKQAEDSLIDGNMEAMTPASNLDDWNCTQKMCASRLVEQKKDIAGLIAASKIVLNDRTQGISSRLYAVCSMKCAAQADKKFEPDVVEYLAGYLRRRVPWIIPAKGEKEPPIKAVRPDVQAALYVIMARDRMKNVGFDINLIGTDLRGADLSFANLYNTNLSFTNLSSTDMGKAYGLMDWNKVYLATIDEATKIPKSIHAGFIVVKKPQLPLQPAGSYTVTSDDWVYWTAVPVK